MWVKPRLCFNLRPYSLYHLQDPFLAFAGEGGIEGQHETDRLSLLAPNPVQLLHYHAGSLANLLNPQPGTYSWLN